MSAGPAANRPFLTAPMGRLFVSNALPMALVMSMSGLLNIVDAAFLGQLVGPSALAAVSLCFPVVMITIALSSMVSGGMSSLLARHLGAQDSAAAGVLFSRAHGLALSLSLCLIVAFAEIGPWMLHQLSGTRPVITAMAYGYLLILIFGTPIQFLLALHADALRNEGRVGVMALLSVGVTLANIALDYVLIAGFDFGVAGSAWGTVAAQGLGLVLLIGLRLRDPRMLPIRNLRHHPWYGGWRTILVHGAPLSLGFVGMALVSATAMAALYATTSQGTADAVAAYGVVMRLFGFCYLPLMAIALTTQSIVGNNVGAGLYHRSDAALRLALALAFLFGLSVELVLLVSRMQIGAAFVEDPAVWAQVGKILLPMSLFYSFTGPILVLALYFQAVGHPGRAAALTLVKPYVLCPPLIVAFASLFGPRGIWFAFPLADALLVLLAARLALKSLTRSVDKSGFGLTRAHGAN